MPEIGKALDGSSCLPIGLPELSMAERATTVLGRPQITAGVVAGYIRACLKNLIRIVSRYLDGGPLMSKRIRGLLILSLVLIAASATGGPIERARSLEAAPTEESPPPGANNWECRPSAQSPQPVVLVHGTFASMAENWFALSPYLVSQGYCVFALNYGNRGTQSVADSAQELAVFVDKVGAAAGATKVSIVGHSQGGLMPRYFIRFLGGASKVNELIGLAPSNHGTIVAPWGTRSCQACVEQSANSAFLQKLNEGRDVEVGVDYTVIATRYDEVVIPYQSQFLNGPPEQVTNVTLQDRCPMNLSNHGSVAFDSAVFQWILNGLSRAGPADPSFRPVCL